MTEATATITHPAALAAATVLAQQAPGAWPLAAPYLDALFHAFDNGHSFITLEHDAAQTLRQAMPIVGTGGDFTPLILQDTRLFLGRLWQIEHDIAVDLIRLAQADTAPVDSTAAAASLTAWFSAPGSNGQQAAAALALLQPLMLINGGPGTGKTTTVAKVLALICQNQLCQPSGSLPRIALAAPTGKAAAHMANALQSALVHLDTAPEIQAHLRLLNGQTVHRLLGLRPPLQHSHFDADNPLPLDVLVVDEASMLDVSLLRTLLRSLRSGCRLILLGDHHQLPAVGVGNVLGALAQPTQISRALAVRLAALLPGQVFTVNDAAPALAANVSTLATSHRFDDGSGIGCLAAAVVSAHGAEAVAAFDAFPQQLRWATRAQIQQPWPVLYRIQAAYWQAVAAHDIEAAFAALPHIMVLAAWRRDADDFNQGYLHWLARHGHHSNERWFSGRLLMVSQNDNDTGLYNGDIGIVLPGDNGLAAYFADGSSFRAVSLSRLPEHDTAFAITVHKSQGSEYDQVWLLPPSGTDDAAALFERALLYTAITRARRQFVFMGVPPSLQAAAERTSPRRCGLSAALVTEAARQNHRNTDAPPYEIG